jgi:hypothetical protein
MDSELIGTWKRTLEIQIFEHQLNMYRQQWQADQQKHIIAKIAGKMTGKTNEGKRKRSERNHQNSNGGRISTHQVNNSRGGPIGSGRGPEEETTASIGKMLNVSTVSIRKDSHRRHFLR